MQQPERRWLGVGILPPHAQHPRKIMPQTYALSLKRMEAEVNFEKYFAA